MSTGQSPKFFHPYVLPGKKAFGFFAKGIIKTPVNDFNQVGIVKPLAY